MTQSSEAGSRKSRESARRSQARFHGFTLIEIAAVTLLLAILAGAVVWSFSTPIDRARAAEALDRVRAFDETARRTSVATGRNVSLVYEPGGSTIERFDRLATGEVFLAAKVELPPGYRIERLTSMSQSAARDGRVSVDVADGRSTTYAVQIVGAGLDRWMLFAGLSGQATQVSDEREVQSILNAGSRTTP